MTKKQLDLFCKKVLERVERILIDEPKEFKYCGCKNLEDVLLVLGGEVWNDILYEVGYSPRFQDEVLNFSPRFRRLFDKVVATFDKEIEEKIMKIAFN